MEKSLGISRRWTWSVQAAREIVIRVILNERSQIIETLRTLAHERKFLLRMKQLYASKGFIGCAISWMKT